MENPFETHVDDVDITAPTAPEAPAGVVVARGVVEEISPFGGDSAVTRAPDCQNVQKVSDPVTEKFPFGVPAPEVVVVADQVAPSPSSEDAHILIENDRWLKICALCCFLIFLILAIILIASDSASETVFKGKWNKVVMLIFIIIFSVVGCLSESPWLMCGVRQFIFRNFGFQRVPFGRFLFYIFIGICVITLVDDATHWSGILLIIMAIFYILLGCMQMTPVCLSQVKVVEEPTEAVHSEKV